MRRIMFTVAATVLMAGAVPASALAHHHHHKHHRSHHRIRFERFGDNSAPTTMNSSDNAGTVQSFQNGVLTIALNDGSTVKGMVTNDTELECTAPENSSTTHEDGDGGSGDQGSGDDNQGSGDDNQASGTEDQGDNDANEDQGEDQNEDQNENEAGNCSTSNLTPGTVVHEASLRIGGSGATWEKVELVS